MVQKIKQDISIGNNIRSLRKQAHLTQEQVVTYLQLQGLGTSRSSYSQMECGTYNIRVSELTALAELFHTDYNAFFANLSPENFDEAFSSHSRINDALSKRQNEPNQET